MINMLMLSKHKVSEINSYLSLLWGGNDKKLLYFQYYIRPKNTNTICKKGTLDDKDKVKEGKKSTLPWR